MTELVLKAARDLGFESTVQVREDHQQLSPLVSVIDSKATSTLVGSWTPTCCT